MEMMFGNPDCISLNFLYPSAKGLMKLNSYMRHPFDVVTSVKLSFFSPRRCQCQQKFIRVLSVTEKDLGYHYPGIMVNDVRNEIYLSRPS